MIKFSNIPILFKSIVFHVRHIDTFITQANIYLSYRKHDDIKRVEFYEKITSVDGVFALG